MLAKTSTITGVVIGMTLFAARAHAQPDPDSEAKPTTAVAAAGDGDAQLTLPTGKILVNAIVGIGLSTGAAFKPITISPDIWYGVTPDITAGLVHSTVGSSGFIGGGAGGAAPSLCVTGSDSGCADLYSGFGVDARYKLTTGMLSWAADGGVYVRHITDPLLLAVKLGAVGRWHQGQLAIELDPNLFIGVTNRDVNGDAFNLPVTVFFAVNPMIAVSAQSGIVLPLQNTGDAYDVPLSVAGHYHVNDNLEVALAFNLLKLIGGGSGSGFDLRSLTFGGTYAF
jgi:hypothetical protein